MKNSNWYIAQRLTGWFVFLLAIFAAEVGFSQEADTAESLTTEQEATESQEDPEKPAESKDAAQEEVESETKTKTEEPTPSSSSKERPVRPASIEPHASRVRAVRAIRFSVFVSAVLLSMLTTVSLMKVNRLTHGKYAGRLWWAGLLLIPGGLLVGAVWAWNNDFWIAWLDGPLL